MIVTFLLERSLDFFVFLFFPFRHGCLKWSLPHSAGWTQFYLLDGEDCSPVIMGPESMPWCFDPPSLEGYTWNVMVAIPGCCS